MLEENIKLKIEDFKKGNLAVGIGWIIGKKENQIYILGKNNYVGLFSLQDNNLQLNYVEKYSEKLVEGVN